MSGKYSAYTGLTQDQVSERTKRGLTNARPSSGTRTVKEIVKENIFTYFNLVFVILAALLFIAGAYSDTSFLLIIAANSGIGIFQELRAKSVLDRMNLMTEPTVDVIRDGVQLQIASSDMVMGDYVILKTGMQIPADCIVKEGTLRVNESILTGESDEIVKTRGSKVLSGSFAIAGDCLAEALAVGNRTYAARLTKEATVMKRGEQSEILRALNRMLKFFGILIIPLGIVLFLEQFYFSGLPFRGSISGTVAALIGMIPEGIYLTASVALVVSAMKLSARKVLVHDLKCIETLARVDILCVDKTGTITEPDMHVTDYVSLSDEVTKEGLEELLSTFAASVKEANDTMQAIQNRFPQGKKKKVTDSCPFSSKYKYSALQFDGRNYVLGAPEFVLGSSYPDAKDAVDAYGKNGCRVLALAEYPFMPQGENLQERQDISLRPLALIALENPIREGAQETFDYFAREGVEVRVISGDNPLTVSLVAGQAGIRNADRYVDVSTLKDDRQLALAAGRYTVFGRVSPDQKKKLVAAMQQQGKKVAMTGDGVNDIIAMKQSDCSVAMASGSEAAAQAAQLVLMDSDFTRMPHIVNEGRRVVNNIERAASLYLVKNIFSLLLAVFSVILMWNYPLNPSQITLISLFTIGIPSFVLALEPNHDAISGRFMRNIILKALPAGITDFVVVSALILFGRVFQLDASSLSTACSIIVAVVGFLILLQIMRPMKAQHVVMIVAVIAGWAASMLLFPGIFGISAVSGKCFMLLVIFTITTEPILRYLSMIFNGISRLSARRAEKSRGKRHTAIEKKPDEDNNRKQEEKNSI